MTADEIEKLIARLEARKRGGGFKHTVEDGVNVLTHQPAPDPLCQEAAAAIRELEARVQDWQAAQHYSYIGKDGKPVLARDLEARAEAAEAKLAEVEKERDALQHAADEGKRLWAASEATVATLTAQVEAMRGAGEGEYLIVKRGMYYRPNSQGYTSSAAEAGRYTLAQAVFITHPNGPDGPRDGMSYVPARAALTTENDNG